MTERAKLLPDRMVDGTWRVECELDDGAIEVAVFQRTGCPRARPDLRPAVLRGFRGSRAAPDAALRQP